jgi:hypothetical protein
MPRSKRPAIAVRALLLASAVAVAVALAWPPGEAMAATDSVTVVNPGAQTSSGGLTLTLDSSSALSGVVAHLTDSSGTDVLDPVLDETSSMTLSTGVIQSVWSVATPIAEGTAPNGIPLGVYSIALDVSFTDGGSSPVSSAGKLYFAATPQVTLTADPTDVSYADQQVTLSGQVTLDNPDGTVTPYQGGVVLDETWRVGTVTVPTDAEGDFSVVVSPNLVAGPPSVFAQVYYGAPGMNADSNDINLDLTVDKAMVTAALSSPTIRYGTAETLSGTISYQAEPGGSYSPAADEPFQVYDASSGTPVVKGTTNASGGYAVRLPANIGNTWTVEAGGPSLDTLLDYASASAGESVQIPTVITNFHTSLSQYWKLSFSGCLGLPEAISGANPRNAGLHLQYALSPRGPWRAVGAAFSFGNRCGSDGVSFTGSATAPGNYVYYRVYTPGTTAAATPSQPKYLTSTSGTSLSWKYADRITGLSVSPHVVANNGRLTVKGQLQFYSDYKWRDYGSQTVSIIFRRKGSGTWYWIVKAKTNSSGHFSATVKDEFGSATWSAQFNGNGSHLATAPAGVYVRVS